VEREVQRGIDPTAEPLMRATLLHVGPQQHVLALVVHHLAADEISIRVVLDELAQLYRARLHGAAADLPVAAPTYLDHVLARNPVADNRIEFWRRTLHGAPALLDLPTDRPRPARRSGAGGTVELRIPVELQRRILDVASTCGATQFMVLQAALASLLERLGAGSDLPIGTTVAGRDDPAHESVVGPFLNPVVLRTDTSGNPSFVELVGRVRAADLAALAHADVPFDHVVDAVEPNRSLSANPLFQILLELHAGPGPELALPGLVSEVDPARSMGGSRLDLEFVLFDRRSPREAPTGLVGHLTYDADLFDRSRAESLVRWLVRLLSALTESPHAPIGAAVLLDDDEYHRVVGIWNDTALAVPTDTVPELVARQARRVPEHPAIIEADGVVLTYAALNVRANRVAHRLRAAGIGPEDCVGVCLRPGPDLFVALLAVLKAGAAYVPLDPAHPPARHEAILADTAASVVLVDDRGPHGQAGGGPLVAVVAEWAADGTEDDPVKRHATDNTVYVMYTSGSTGRPKGVVVTHAGLMNYLWWAAGAYGVERGSGAPMVGSVAFDLSVPNFLLPLVTGRTVTLLPPDDGVDSLAKLLRSAEGLSLLKITPGHLDMLRAALPAGTLLDSVGTYVVGADEVRPETIAAWRRIAPTAEILNEYGPTETVVGCSAHRITDDFDPERPVPIGRPIANTRMYVLDDCLRPVPAGVAGELYIAGTGVARGYLNRPGLTAVTFLPDPLGPAGTRMYRSGDRARYTDDGTLEFLGRRDDQVKIRGFRIEPGEIEAHLLAHPDVREAVVLARTVAGNRSLIAHVVPRTGSAPAETELRAHLAERLPGYMVPNAWSVLDAMPLTTAGKVDKAALPDPARPAAAHRPVSTAEQVVCDVVGELLGRRDVMPADNFFALGGDSIVSMRLVALARQAGVHLDPTQVYLADTLAEMVVGVEPTTSQAVVHDPGKGAVQPTPPLRWLDEQPADIDTYRQSLVLRTPPDADLAGLTAALQALLDRHDLLRARLVRGTDGRLDRLDVPPPGAVSAADLIERTAAPTEPDHATIDSALSRAGALLRPRDGRMVRAIWLDPGSGRQGRLVLAIHHAVVDGVSWRILATDLADAWRGVPLEPVPTSYRTWSRTLGEAARAAHVVAQADDWVQILQEPTALWPDDGPTAETAETAADAATVNRITFDVSDPAGGDPVEELLLAAVLVALSAHGTAGGALIVELEGHGRMDHVLGGDLSRTVGWFTAEYPVRLTLGSPDLARASAEVRSALGAVPDRGVGFGLLRYLDPIAGPRLAALARPQVGLNYLGRVEDSAADWAPCWALGQWTSGGDDLRPAHQLTVTAMSVGSRLVIELATPAPSSVARLRAVADRVQHVLTVGPGAERSAAHLVALSPGELERLSNRASGASTSGVSTTPLAVEGRRRTTSHEDRVGEFYSDFPYPWLASRLTAPSDPTLFPALVCQELGDFEHRRLRPDARVWVAGCGVNQALMTALRFPAASVIGSDISTESLRLCAAAADQLGVNNLELREEGLNGVSYREEFDYVLCTGVVHHDPDPAAVLSRVGAALRPTGIAEVMVYNRFHRQEIIAFQEALRLLGTADDIWYAKRLAASIASGTRLSAELTEALTESDEQFADTWLNPMEHSYTVHGFAALADAAGMALEAPCVSAVGRAEGAFEWAPPTSDPHIGADVGALDDLDRWQLHNLLRMEQSPYLWFYLRRTDNPHPAMTEWERDEAFLDAALTPITDRERVWVLDPEGGYRRVADAEIGPRRGGSEYDAVVDAVARGRRVRSMPSRDLGDVRRARVHLTVPEFPRLRARP
jgi:amino acid adenylation domain-containing protein/non-ribosomal peptide synthase protein (TIGR01720 family)